MQLIERLGEKYEADELAAKYDFTGRTPMGVPEALAIKEELEKIDELLKQLEEARENAQIGIIDMETLAEFAEPGEMEQLSSLQQQIADYVRDAAERQGLERNEGTYRLTPDAYRVFQGKLLERIFSQLEASRTGRHQGPIQGEGAVELQQTKPYEFGDSITHMDIPQSFINAMVRDGGGVADSFETGRYRNPSDAKQSQMCDRCDHGHERLDALRRSVHEREAHGFSTRWPDPQ